MMTIGELKRAIADIDDALFIVLACKIEDEDGDEVEHWFGADLIEARMEPDTAEDYAYFAGGDLLPGCRLGLPPG